MAKWWTERWSIGIGRSRIYCGIARTEDGFAVDVFHGDTCIESDVYDSRAEAIHATQSRELLYRRGESVSRHEAHWLSAAPVI